MPTHKWIESRRHFVALATGFCIIPSVIGSKVVAQPEPMEDIPGPDTPTEFRWELPRKYAEQVVQRLNLPPENVSPAPNGGTDRGGPLVLIVVGIVALGMLAETIMHIYRDVRYGGLIVEDQGKTVSVKNDPRLPGRVIIVKDKNGIEVRELSGSVTTGELVGALSKMKGSSKRSAKKE